MTVKTWFYYLHHNGNAIAKTNTETLQATMQAMGFRQCAKTDYMKVRKMLRDQEQKALNINITGSMK